MSQDEKEDPAATGYRKLTPELLESGNGILTLQSQTTPQASKITDIRPLTVKQVTEDALTAYRAERVNIKDLPAAERRVLLEKLPADKLRLHLADRFRTKAESYRKKMETATDSFQRETFMKLAELSDDVAIYVETFSETPPKTKSRHSRW